MKSMFNRAPDFAGDHHTAVLPVGSLEQHGSHLPVGTDTMIANAFAKGLAERLDAYLLPAIPISNSLEQRKCKATVYIRSSTLSAIVQDIASALHHSGYERLVVVNGHGGNFILKPTIREINRLYEPFQAILIYGTGVAQDRLGDIVEHTQDDVHAGEKETSIMLHLDKTLVGTINYQADKKFSKREYLDYFDIKDLTFDGYWGYPECGSAAKGKELLDLYIEGALQQLEEIDCLKKNIAGS